MGGAGDWEALENGSAGGWEALENGRRWRLEGAGDWEAWENGRRWRLGKAPENFALQPPALAGGTEKGGTLSRVGSRVSDWLESARLLSDECHRCVIGVSHVQLAPCI